MQNYTTGLGSAAHCGLIFRTGGRPAGSNQGSQHTCWSSIDPPNQNSIQWTPEMKTLHSTRLICRGYFIWHFIFGKSYFLNPITLSAGWRYFLESESGCVTTDGGFISIIHVAAITGNSTGMLNLRHIPKFAEFSLVNIKSCSWSEKNGYAMVRPNFQWVYHTFPHFVFIIWGCTDVEKPLSKKPYPDLSRYAVGQNWCNIFPAGRPCVANKLKDALGQPEVESNQSPPAFRVFRAGQGSMHYLVPKLIWKAQLQTWRSGWLKQSPENHKAWQSWPIFLRIDNAKI